MANLENILNLHTAPHIFDVITFDVTSEHLGGRKAYKVYASAGSFAAHLARHILAPEEHKLWQKYFGLEEDFCKKLAPIVKKYKEYHGPSLDANDAALIEQAYEFLVEKFRDDVTYAVGVPILAKLNEKPISQNNNRLTTIFPGRAGVLGFEDDGVLRTFYFPKVSRGMVLADLLAACDDALDMRILKANAGRYQPDSEDNSKVYIGISGEFLTPENRINLTLHILELTKKACAQNKGEIKR